MGESDFEAIGTSEERMFGPRAFLACGFDPTEQKQLLLVLDDAGVGDVPVCFASDADVNQPLELLASRAVTSGLGQTCGLARAVVLSGATEAELHRVMGAYRHRGMPRPLWATMTETSAAWSLQDLVAELGAERRAIEGRS